MTKSKTNPPCADWRVWIGHEIEGAGAIGVKTLFVRYGDVLKHADEHPDITRVWLCKEYLSSHSEVALTVLARKLRMRGLTIAVEVLAQYYKEYLYLRPYVHYYIKYEALGLIPGDHICVGSPFHDEGFCIGHGKKMTPKEYEQDVFIE